MKMALLRVDFVLHGCASLKDKRRRLARLRDKFGGQTGMAVCESGWPDEHRRAQWSFVAVAASATVVEQALATVETYVATALDAQVADIQREWLA